MDIRLIILAVTFALVVVSIIVLIVTLARSGRHNSPDDQMEVAAGDWPMLSAAPDDSADTSLNEGPFVVPKSGMAAVLSQPLRTGTWRPDAPTPPSSAAPSGRDYWDSLIDQPELVLREPAPRPSPSCETSAQVEPPLESELVAPAPAPAPAAQLEPTTLPAAMPEPLPVSTAVSEPVLMPAAVLEPPQTPIVVLESVPTQMPAPEPPAPPELPVSLPVDVVEQEWIAELVAELDTVEVAPAPAPISAEDSVAKIIASFDAESTPPRPAVSVPATPIPPTEVERPKVAPPSRPLEPRPAVVTHMTEPIPQAEPFAHPQPVSPAPITPITEPADSVSAPATQATTAVDSRVANVPDHEMVAPVEMWFGDARVGVKPGSKTYDRFQRIAQVLFDDLRQAKSGS